MQQGGGSLPPSEFGVAFLAPAPEQVAPISTFNELGLQVVEEEQGISPGNRWPRQETSALLAIRSDMDAAFRVANLKSPLWEEVSRRLTEQGYRRSAKKCKEKFENVYKYYNRTKDARAGRQDGKCYRFFSQLEALHSPSSTASAIAGDTDTPAPVPRVIAPPPSTNATITTPITAAAPIDAFRLSSSSNTSSYSGTDSEEDREPVRRKRKKEGADGGEETPKGRQKLMTFFEVLMQQVLERQEAMQQRFLEAIERREQHRMIREEAWRRQDVSRIAREQELAAEERSMAASRAEAIVAFLQKLTGRKIPIPPPSYALQTTVPSATAAPEETPTSPPHQGPPTQKSTEIITSPPELHQAVPPQEHRPAPWAIISTEPGLSRWPKSEVHALIKLRSGMEARYQESGPKGPLWEDISEGMRRLGYNRSSKRCKEKWENINKYFKKVKESKKKRAEDDKTCPYFHQLDAFYHRKFASLPAAASPPPRQQADNSMPEECGSGGGFSLGFFEEGPSSAVAVKHMSSGRS